jgi:hypothetical protein
VSTIGSRSGGSTGVRLRDSVGSSLRVSLEGSLEDSSGGSFRLISATGLNFRFSCQL